MAISNLQMLFDVFLGSLNNVRRLLFIKLTINLIPVWYDGPTFLLLSPMTKRNNLLVFNMVSFILGGQNLIHATPLFQHYVFTMPWIISVSLTMFQKTKRTLASRLSRVILAGGVSIRLLQAIVSPVRMFRNHEAK